MASASRLTLGLIVEGHGEVQAMPVLIRHIARDFDFCGQIHCEPRRIPRSRLVKPGEIERALEALTRQIGRSQPVLVLLDADDDCPKELSASLNARCRAAHADVRISIVIAQENMRLGFSTPPGPFQVKAIWRTA